ncbi:MAG: endo-1,4-beta-xylanase [Oscillospiraceae bacterium]|nr:endo-1,4-beta-xylanase [Oscillospiraceae bacterium]
MKMKKTGILLACIAMAMSALFVLPATADEEMTELLVIDFSDEARHGSLFMVSDADSGAIITEWVTQPGIGNDDDSALRVTHQEGKTYLSSSNAIRLTFPAPLPPGAIYNIKVSFYVPAEGNEGKGTLTGPGFVLNGDYPGAQGVVKFPESFGTMPVGTWKNIDVTLPMQTEDITSLDFRFVINEEDKHPDLWYIDNIIISQIGEAQEIEIPYWDLSLPSLKETFAQHFPVGNILEPHNLNNEALLNMFRHHYAVVTLENAMKPASLTREKDEYNFASSDQVVNWAIENGIDVHGHTLVWHSQSAAWLTNGSDGSPLTRAEARANMENYINEVAGHFKGKVISWDVVNEAFINSPGSGGWKSQLRGSSGGDSSPWYAAYANGADADSGESGADYLYDAFVFTRLADPGAMLFYTDFNETEQNKSEAMASMARELNGLWKDDPRNTDPDRPLVEAIGMQAHYWTSDLNPDNISSAIMRFVAAGCKVGIMELDICIGSYGGLSSRDGTLTEDEAKRQAELYKGAFDVFVRYSEHITRVTFWGREDSTSWRGKASPLLFDGLYSAKPAFWAIMGIMGINQDEYIAPDSGEETPPPEEEQTPEPETPPPLSPASPSPDVTDPGDTGEPDLTLLFICIAVIVVLAAGVSVFVFRKKKKQG